MIAERERRQREQTAGYGTGPSMPVPQAHNPTDRRERGARDYDVEQWKRGVEESVYLNHFSPSNLPDCAIDQGSGPSRNDSTHRSRQARSEELEYPPNTYSGAWSCPCFYCLFGRIRILNQITDFASR